MNFDPTRNCARADMSSKKRGLFAQLRRSRLLLFGVPFVSLLVIGSFGLSEFTSMIHKRRDDKARMLTADEMLSYHKKIDNVDVEEEFKRLNEKLDIEHWENKRGPRPWEESEQKT